MHRTVAMTILVVIISTIVVMTTATEVSSDWYIDAPIGQIRGRCHGLNDTSITYPGVCSAFGVPFAQPPLGSLRFAPPRSLSKLPTNTNEEQLFDATGTATPVSCPQSGTRYNPTSEGIFSHRSI
jgi:carboxylesterase type B